MQSPLNRTDRRILTAALLLLLISLYLMYDDAILFPENTTSGKTLVGKVERTEEDVRRKRSRQFAWKSARSKDQLFSGDSIFTGEKSSVEIAFQDGRKLILSENSLVVFNSLGNQLDLNFQIQGCVIAVVNGKKTEICGDNSTVQLDNKGLEVLEGDAKEQVAEAAKITWQEAPRSEFYHWKRNQTLRLSWAATGTFGRYQVQFSKSQDFTKVEFQEKSLKRNLRSNDYPSKGRYFVRVEGQDLNGKPLAYSPPVAVQFIEADIPRLTQPTKDQIFEFARNADSELLEPNQVAMTWAYQKPEMPFELQISKTSEFTEILSTLEGKGLKAASPKLEPGQYFVRVRDRAMATKEEPVWSESIPFEVAFGEPRALAAPILLTKKISHRLPAEKDPVIRWQKVQSASKYVVETSRTPDFENSAEFETENLEAMNRKLFPGKSYFRVSAISPKGNRGLPAIGEITVGSEIPVLAPIEPRVVLGKSPEDPGDPQEFPVSWTPIKVADSYLIEVSSDKEFTAPKKYQSRDPSSFVTMQAPGEAFYRVRPLDVDGTPLTAYSKPGLLNYILKVPLATPDLKEPFNQVTLFFQKTTEPYFWMEWSPVRQADLYILEVSKQPDFSQKVLTIETKQSRYLVKEVLPQGKLYWRVRAYGDSGRESAWSPPNEMSVFSGRRPAGR